MTKKRTNLLIIIIVLLPFTAVFWKNLLPFTDFWKSIIVLLIMIALIIKLLVYMDQENVGEDLK